MPTFRPPSTREKWTDQKPFAYFTADMGSSVVKRGGVWTTVRNLDAEEIFGLVEGADYFQGGHIYTVTTALADELVAAGYTVEE